jgi:predicted dehydrogenase
MLPADFSPWMVRKAIKEVRRAMAFDSVWLYTSVSNLVYYFDSVTSTAQVERFVILMIHAAIIGCGTVAPVHAYALKQLPGVSLTACADIKFERAESMAQNYGLRAYDSMEKLLENEHIDVVHLCTPHYLHVPMAQLAASRGIHVFSEKPPAINRAQWAALLEVSKRVRVGVCFQNRYNGSVVRLREMLASGSLGKVLGARAFVTWTRSKEYYTESGWRGNQNTEGGGVLINQAIHTLDLMVYLLGKPQHVEAALSNHHLKGIIDVEDTVEACMMFGDAPGLFYATTAYCSNSPVFIEVVCQNATVRMEKDTLSVAWEGGEEERFEYKSVLPEMRDYWGAAHVTCIREFYDALINNRDVPIGPKQVQDTIDTMFAIYGK